MTNDYDTTIYYAWILFAIYFLWVCYVTTNDKYFNFYVKN